MNDRLLVVAPSWVGDMVMAQVLFKSLLRTRPGMQLDVMAPAAVFPLLSRMPEVDNGLLFELDHGQLHLSYRRQFARRVNALDYDQVIILPNSAKSALVPWFSGIERRTGFLGEMRYFLLNDIRLMDKKRLPRMIDRFIALGDENETTQIAYPQLVVAAENQLACRNRLGLTLDAPVLSLCPGAEFGDAKRWPEAHYAELANQAIERGMQVWIFGSAKDEPVAAQIVNQVKRSSQIYNLTGNTSLLDAIDLLALSRLVVSNDSGLMHIAAAVGCDTAVLYGSTSPDFTPPLTEKVDILSENLSCSPCFKRECPLEHKNCLNRLDPARLDPVLDRVLGQGK